MGPNDGAWNSGDYDYFGGQASARPPHGAPPPGATPPTSIDRFGAGPGATAVPIAPGSASRGFGAPSTIGGPGGWQQPPNAAPPRKKGPSVLTKVVLGGVAVVVLLIGFAVFGATQELRTAKNVQAHTTVALAQTAGPYVRMHGDRIAALEATAIKDLPSTSTTDAQAGLYSVNGRPGAVVVAAKLQAPSMSWNLHFGTGDKDPYFRGMEEGFERSGAKMAPFTSIRPGLLGGTVKCTTGTFSGVATPVRACGTIDHGAVTFLVFYDASTPDAAVIALRQATEHRS